MADQKISELTAITGANTADDDELVIVDTSASQTKKITLGELENALAERDFSFGDNDKLTFGAGSDLQIYHDGSNSYISDEGTGSLNYRASNRHQFLNADGSKTYMQLVGDIVGQEFVQLRYDNSTKLATTSTGVDITGTLTSDGLTVAQNGATNVTLGEQGSGDSTTITIGKGFDAESAIWFQAAAGNYGGLVMPTNEDIIISLDEGNALGSDKSFLVQGAARTKTHFSVQETGDISFYEDTGTTPKFFWDANNEALGINTTTFPSLKVKLAIQGTAGASGSTTNTAADEFFIDNDGDTGMTVGSANTGRGYYAFADSDVALRGGLFYDHSTDDMGFRVSSNTRMTIDSSGNVGIGTSSPSYAIHTKSSSGGVGLIESTSSNSDLYFKDSGTTYNYSNGIGSVGNALRFRSGDGSERMRIDSSGNLLVGTTTDPATLTSTSTVSGIGFNGASGYGVFVRNGSVPLYANRRGTDGDIISLRKDGTTVGSIGVDDGTLKITHSDSAGRTLEIKGPNSSDNGYIGTTSNHPLVFVTNGATNEAMRITSSGNLLVGTTDTTLYNETNTANAGLMAKSNGQLQIATDGTEAAYFNRLTSDGKIVQFRKDGSTVGSIGSFGGNLLVDGGSAKVGLGFRGAEIRPRDNGVDTDGGVDLGSSGYRFKDLYLSGTGYVGTSLGIGTSSPSRDLEVYGAVTPRISIVSGNTSTGSSALLFGDADADNIGSINYAHVDNSMRFSTSSSEAMRIDSSGNVLVGTTNLNLYQANNDSTADNGFVWYEQYGFGTFSRNDNNPLILNRTGTDGDIVQFRKDGSTVGSIGAHSTQTYIGTGDTGLYFNAGNDSIDPYNTSTPVARSDAISLGAASRKFKDLYLSGGVYLGGTGSANKLDDYEVGDWTPTLKCGSVVATLEHISGGLNIPATYTKIGRQVTLHAEVDVSNLNGGTSGVRISNLPFTVADDIYPTSLEASGSVSYFDMDTGIGSISVVANSTSELLFYITTSSTQTTPTEMTGTHIGAGELRFSISYNTN
jgi:signal peptidase I